jgi:hypothetical protein
MRVVLTPYTNCPSRLASREAIACHALSGIAGARLEMRRSAAYCSRGIAIVVMDGNLSGDVSRTYANPAH